MDGVPLPPEELERVRRICRRLVPHLDWESLASDIWLEARERNYARVPYIMIRHKAISLVRHEKRELASRSEHERLRDPHALSTPHDTELVARLFQTSGLDAVEKNVIFERFWLDRQFPEIARSLSLSVSGVSCTYHRAMVKMYVKWCTLGES